MRRRDRQSAIESGWAGSSGRWNGRSPARTPGSSRSNGARRGEYPTGCTPPVVVHHRRSFASPSVICSVPRTRTDTVDEIQRPTRLEEPIRWYGLTLVRTRDGRTSLRSATETGVRRQRRCDDNRSQIVGPTGFHAEATGLVSTWMRRSMASLETERISPPRSLVEPPCHDLETPS